MKSRISAPSRQLSAKIQGLAWIEWSIEEDPTGEANNSGLRLDFNRRLMLQFRGSTITSDAGLLAYRELDDTLGLTDAGAGTLADARTGKNGRHRGLQGCCANRCLGGWPATRT
jgi:hypothetical protein